MNKLELKIKSENNKRRVILINPRFQLSFMGYVVGMAAVIIGVFYGANLYFFWKFVNKGKEAGLNPNHVFFKFMSEQARTMDYIFIFTSLFALIFLLVYGYYLSHRVAGALYHLENHLNKTIETGTYTELKFRKNDYFQEIPPALNRFVEKLMLRD